MQCTSFQIISHFQGIWTFSFETLTHKREKAFEKNCFLPFLLTFQFAFEEAKGREDRLPSIGVTKKHREWKFPGQMQHEYLISKNVEVLSPHT